MKIRSKGADWKVTLKFQMEDGLLSGMSNTPMDSSVRPARVALDLSGDRLIEWMNFMGAEAQLRRFESRMEIGLGGSSNTWNDMFANNLRFVGRFDFLIQEGPDVIIFAFPLRGSIRFQNGSSIVETHANATAMNARRSTVIQVDDGIQHSSIGINRAVFNERLSELIGEPVIRPLEFQAQVSLENDSMKSLAAFVHCIASTDFGAIVYSHTLMNKEISKLVADMFLACWPNNYTGQLEIVRANVAPKHVKRAVDCIQSNIQDIQTPADLAKISGVSLRSLQYGFKNTFGIGIAEYQRFVRLQKAREEILSGSMRSIKEISESLGFLTAKHFSTSFAKAFGVPPTKLRKKTD